MINNNAKSTYFNSTQLRKKNILVSVCSYRLYEIFDIVTGQFNYVLISHM